MSTATHYPVIIIGGGMVGLTLAAALAHYNISCAVIETKPPQLTWSAQDYHARVSAINERSRTIFENLDLWSQVRQSCFSPLKKLHVWDAVGGSHIDFDAHNLHADQLGVIVENREIVRVLWQHLQSLDHVTLLCPEQAQQLTFNKTATLRLNQATLTADLIVGADGGHSWLRQQAGIDLQQRPYHHHAVVAVIKTEKPHLCCAYQPFLKTGPLGVLPLADPHTSAIVWSTHPAHAEQLVAMEPTTFNHELTNALNNKLGMVTQLSKPIAIPLIMRHAKNYVQPRIALLGDAAHTIHPLAGQGVNLGLMDAACLAQCLSESKHADLGALRALRRYERWRKGDNALMMTAMRGLQELFSSQSSLTIQARNMGLKYTNRFDWLKKLIMQQAAGSAADSPQLANVFKLTKH